MTASSQGGAPRAPHALDPRAPDPSDLGPDLTDCDREPIHVPGAIQPHGMLLVAEAGSGRVIGGAGDLEGRLSAGWLGASLGDLLGPDAGAAAAGLPASGRVMLGQVRVPSGLVDAIGHRAGERLLVELEPSADGGLSATRMLAMLDEASAVLGRATGIEELCRRAAGLFREITGYDRVMVYRFLDDDAGVVVAEDKVPELESFLNHHFPASDIPRQARALYVRNLVRVIPDVHYTPAPLRPDEAGLRGIDLSDVDLRSVSPIHLQYLKNMGIAASASVSIVKDGILWGLVACHHREPRQLSYEARLACRAAAGGMSRQIRGREEAEVYRERLRLRAAEDAALGSLGGEGSLEDYFARTGEDLRRMLDADSFAALQGQDIFVAGRAPAADRIREVGAWVRDRANPKPFSTPHLARHFPPAEAFADLASGLLAVTMSTDIPLILMWFRAEHVQVVEWAGNPHKAVQAGPGGSLNPRTSFDAWREIVRHRARPWTLEQVEATGRLRRLMTEERQNRRIRELNLQLAATVSDKESLLAQKDYLLKEVNHRVQNSLQLVGSFLGLQARSAGNDDVTRHLSEAQRRLSAVALVHRRLYSGDAAETVDLGRYLEDLCRDMKSSAGDGWSDMIQLDLAPILISADRAVHVGLILTELVINAQKYAYAQSQGPIAITLDQHRTQFRLTVADRGSGRLGTREGFGTRMMKAMVGQLSGTLEYADNAPGLMAIVTAPLVDPGG